MRYARYPLTVIPTSGLLLRAKARIALNVRILVKMFSAPSPIVQENSGNSHRESVAPDAVTSVVILCAFSQVDVLPISG